MTFSHEVKFDLASLDGDGKPHPRRKLSEREFFQWIDDKTRAEWVAGEVVMMAPASLDHAEFALWLQAVAREFAQYHELGEVYGREVLVRLPRQRRQRLPDLLFVAHDRLNILETNRVDGAPDLVMEVVSPDSVARDWREKYIEYERAGVREYWVIHRQSQRAEVYSLNKSNKYQLISPIDGVFRSKVLKGFYLRLEWLLASEPPSILHVLNELGVK